jgi:thioredoxin-like negative regulator of GroEL
MLLQNTVVVKKLFLLLILFAFSYVFADTEEELFEQVFDNPKSLELNFKLARIQIKNGNFKGAAASLERILGANLNTYIDGIQEILD